MSELFNALSRQDWQSLYDHLGTMPWAPSSWSNNWRSALSEALAITELPTHELFRPTVICRHCGHTEECHGFNEDPTLPRLCDVEVSDWGDLDCSCRGFEAA